MLTARPARHRFQQLDRTDRLAQVVVHARSEATGDLFGQDIGGHGHDRRAGGGRIAHRADMACGGEAVHAWHLHVHQHKVIAPAPHSLDAGRAVIGRFNPDGERFEHGAHQLAIDGVVLDQQQTDGPVRTKRPGVFPRRVGDELAQGRADLEPEARTLALDAIDTDLAFHLLDDPARDRQTQTGAAISPRHRCVSLRKTVEHAAELRLGDADPRVANLDAQYSGVSLDLLDHRDRHSADLGELDRVGQEIQQHLRQARRVRQHGAQAFGRDDGQGQPLGPGLPFDQRSAVGDHGVGAEGLGIKLDPAGLQAREVQHVVDDAEQGVAGVLDQAHMVRIALRQGAGPAQYPGKADNGVQRRAQFVSHVGQKVGLGRPRRLGQIEGLLEVQLQPLALGDHP